ncbi:MAG: Nif3-like dinuclear metal center hexameric protein [Planctomycetaceae bacterium]|nr:Nif3-like dinuclear metal center hexameric protein [Planctomycetaceae bacterium]
MKRTSVLEFLEAFAPLSLAEDWDNVGLLLGDREGDISRVMTCLTLTPDVAEEALEEQVDLVVTHHPLLFRPVRKITTETSEGAMLLRLAGRGIAVYSPHTAFDSARQGINQQWCERLELRKTQPLRPFATMEDTGMPHGSGRAGDLAESVSLPRFLELVKTAIGIERLQFVGESSRHVGRVGVACGSAAEFLPEACSLGCDVLLTGEARFHACLEARAQGIGLVLVGHYASERFACEWLANRLQQEFPSLRVHASLRETDPLQWG